MLKKGDRVKVWSLQSWNNGGFLNGEEAVVRQTQRGDSVVLMVPRNFGGTYKVDESYEVYARQCELISSHEEDDFQGKKAAYKDLERLAAELMNNKSIS